MRRLQGLLVMTVVLLISSAVLAQPAGQGVVSGLIRDKSTKGPLEFANVALLNKADTSLVVSTTTDKGGKFSFTNVPQGKYFIECSFIGHTTFRSPYFTIDARHGKADIGTISMTESAFALDEVVVTSEKKIFNYAIDRKVYNIDQDMMSKSSTASELLQNIPSVQVDIDGNVSLRGSTDVMILVNGKRSPLMDRSRADVLQQMPATSIEKIEVITNPSARFTPEGTSGIINIVMKKGAGSGLNGNATAHLGTIGRHNESIDFNYNPGNLDLYASYSYRHDQRNRLSTDARQETAIPSGTRSSYSEDDRVRMRPQAHIANLGLNYHLGESNVFELTGDYFKRKPIRSGTSSIVSRDSNDVLTEAYNRLQSGFEDESERGLTAAFQHSFPKEDHQLRVEANASSSPENENTHFSNVYQTPTGPTLYDNSLVKQNEKQRQLSVDYTNPLNKDSKLEAGYAGELTEVDVDSYADSCGANPATCIPAASKIYQFKADQSVNALYGTFEHTFGKISFLGGLRAELATVKSDLVSRDSTITTNYSGLYPTLHLAYKLNETGQLQLNYSRRVNRPETDELNPFPEYTDPRNLQAGNPRLKPENIHSVELGYQWQAKNFSFVPSIYYRYKFNGFTRVTEAVNDSTTLRTIKNLSSEQSAGLEPVLTINAGNFLTANLNGNVFYDQIDASAIGYSNKKSIVTWSGTFNVNVNPVKTTMLQLNSNYRAARLTPQGHARPSFVLNVGVRQDLLDEKLSLTLAASDILKTQRQDLRLDFGGINEHITFRRDSRIVYLGLTYHFGRPEKKAKEKPLQYEDQQP